MQGSGSHLSHLATGSGRWCSSRPQTRPAQTCQAPCPAGWWSARPCGPRTGSARRQSTRWPAHVRARMHTCGQAAGQHQVACAHWVLCICGCSWAEAGSSQKRDCQHMHKGTCMRLLACLQALACLLACEQAAAGTRTQDGSRCAGRCAAESLLVPLWWHVQLEQRRTPPCGPSGSDKRCKQVAQARYTQLGISAVSTGISTKKHMPQLLCVCGACARCAGCAHLHPS